MIIKIKTKLMPIRKLRTIKATILEIMHDFNI